ncbi:hypothetical protein O181_083812 [Austropuccinia psidii MF-1]|uniref:Uncharacterized protein n=1 Tax=Austropuccinia psidii MF-1 TaxID=1389203 RepID=A0A9Q3FV41_9BASI|nr:hypothetical protein [Austropuccinia psidii MF-1]
MVHTDRVTLQDPFGLSVGSKLQLGHLSPPLAKWPQTPENHVLASNPRGPKMTIGEFLLQDFNHGLSQLPEAPSHVHKGSPPKIRETPNFNSIGLITQEPRMVHIWYYIPLCTIFPQQSNGDRLRTKLRHSNSSPQTHHPFQRKNSQPFSLTIIGSYQKTIQGPQPPGPAGVGLYFLS